MIVVKSTLKESDLKEIFEFLKATFYDVPFFDSLIGEKLWLFLQHSNSFEITEASTKRCVERYYDVSSFDDPTKPERKIVLNQIRLVFKCCTVLLLGYHPLLRSYRWTSIDELIRRYPDFVEIEEMRELQYLLAFRNIIRVALLVIPPLSNKQLLLNIGGRLEGSGHEYITGTGQKICVTRRVIIYEQEGRVTSQKKKPKTPQISQPVQQLAQAQSQHQQNHLEQAASSNSSASNPTSSSAMKLQSISNFVPSINTVKKNRLDNENIKKLSKPNPLLNPETVIPKVFENRTLEQDKEHVLTEHQDDQSQQSRPLPSLEKSSISTKVKYMSSIKVKRIRLDEQDIKELSKPAPMPMPEMAKKVPEESHSSSAIEGGQPASVHNTAIESGDHTELTCKKTGNCSVSSPIQRSRGGYKVSGTMTEDNTEQTLMHNAVMKLVAFYDKATGGGGSVAAARDTITGIVKKYMEEFPEINDEN
eukprot:gene37332-48820_t